MSAGNHTFEMSFKDMYSEIDELMMEFAEGEFEELWSSNQSLNFSAMDLSMGSSSWRTAIYYLDLYLVPVICVVGLTGNLLSFIVFMCTYMRRLSSSVYLAALSVTDSLFLVCLLVSRGGRQSGNSIYTQNGWCQTFLYVTYNSSFLSVWYVVAFTCERYIVVNYPLRRQHLCTTKRAKIVVASLAAFAAVIYSFGLWTSGVNSHDGLVRVCGPTPPFYNLVMILHNIDTVITLILPFLAIAIMNVRIVYKVVLFYRKRKHMALDRTSPTSTTALHSYSSGSALLMQDSAFGRIRRIHCSDRTRTMYTRTQVKVTKMLVIISTLFLVLNLPRHTARAYTFVLSMTGDEHPPSAASLAWQKVFEFLYYLHFALNLFLYSVLGKNFRKAFLWLCRKIRHKVTEYFSKSFFVCCRGHHREDYMVAGGRREIILNELASRKMTSHRGGRGGASHRPHHV